MIGVNFVTCEDAVNELQGITKEKLKYLGIRSFEIAIVELQRALSDIEIIPRVKYIKKMKIAEQLINYKKDIPILAAVFTVAPDYFITGDKHFFTEKIRNIVNVKTTMEFVNEIKR